MRTRREIRALKRGEPTRGSSQFEPAGAHERHTDRDDARDRVAHSAACSSCGRDFAILRGEVQFARRTGLSLPTQCRWHRPTRRQVLAALRVS
jgi:hypothetical protein